MKKVIVIFIMLFLSGCAVAKQEKTIISQEAIKDASCEEIKDVMLKERCYHKTAKEKEEILYCNNITENLLIRDMCYISLSVIKKDVGICENMLTDKESESKDTCYFNYATKLGEIEVCDKVKAKKAKDTCTRVIKDK